MKNQVQEMFLDWFNNYLSLEKFAVAYGLTGPEAAQLIELGREVHERIVAESQEAI